MGRRLRQRRSGPEAEMVDRFIEETDIPSFRSYRTTILREPRLPTGFPDIVAVQWHQPTTVQWKPCRANLSSDDLRLAHLIATRGRTTRDELESYWGRMAVPALKRLQSAGLASEKLGCWRAAPLKASFAVRKIITFEAKISAFARALEQATLNSWFATESYLLVPEKAYIQSIVERCNSRNVGIWISGESTPFFRPRPNTHAQPLSYASWILNEWVWRDSHQVN